MAFRSRTKVDFSPINYFQMAGLVVYINRRNFFFLHKTADDAGRSIVKLAVSDGGTYREVASAAAAAGPAEFEVTMQGTAIRFALCLDGKTWQQIGQERDSTIVSDTNNAPGFTGPFVGMFAQDSTGARPVADFDYFEYFPQDQD